jgi:hypothetical protein
VISTLGSLMSTARRRSPWPFYDNAGRCNSWYIEFMA